MYALSNKEIESLLLAECREVFLPDGTTIEVTATRQHWLAVEECEVYGWPIDEIARLAVIDNRETGREFGECFRGILSYIQSYARNFIGPELIAKEINIPMLNDDIRSYGGS